jgi:cold-inducible RNA-binding protein
MKNIFVGNLSFSVTEQTLRSLFETYGAVGRVNLVTDRDTGQRRGFAFVEMTNNAEAEKAIGALNGREVEGRALNVNEARPKEDRPSRGGGFGRKRW